MNGIYFFQAHTISLATKSKIIDIQIKCNAKSKLHYLNLHTAQNLGKIYYSLSINPVITTCKNDKKCNKIQTSACTKMAYIS